MTAEADQIKANVREHYGRAITEAGSCCGGSCGCASDSTEIKLYGAETLSSVAEVTPVSFGCGNPLAIASLRPGEVVLDLGSGGGLDVLLAAQRVGPSGFVHGVDMTDEMLETARRNAARQGATNVTFHKGDIESLPLPDASIDVIISNCVINLTPDKGQALREALRVLRPGGRLAVSDIVIEGGLDGLPVNEAQIRAALNWVGCISGALTREQYEELLAAAGFAAIDVAVQQRYTVEDLLTEVPEALRDLPEAALRDLAGRFTSSAITARRPVAE